jgi:gluconokinase
MRSNLPTPSPARILVVMGVSGSGKTEIGQRLARRLGGSFFDSDQYHPAANIAKMSAGIPLTDEDRWPWYQRLRNEVIDPCAPAEIRVLACSALKRSHRAFLRAGRPEAVRFIHLVGDYDLIFGRLSMRTGHFMRPEMLRSQFETLEPTEPGEALVVSVEGEPGEIVSAIVNRLDELGVES